MKKAILFTLVLLGISLSAQTSRADTIEYSVSIDVTWSNYAIGGGSSNPFFNDCGNTCGDVAVQFAAAFDVYANGGVVPGSMTDLISAPGGYLINGPYSFDTTPLSYTGSQTNTGIAVAVGSPYSWSDINTETATFVPPGCTYLFFPPATSTCPPSGWLPSSGSVTYGPSTVVLNSFTSGGFFDCWFQGCAQGGDNPADGGSVVVTEFTVAPEASTLLSLSLGLVLLFGFKIRAERSARMKPSIS